MSKKKSRKNNPPIEFDPNLRRDIAAVLMGLLAVIFALAIAGSGGPVGANTDYALTAIFGFGRYLVPAYFAYLSLKMFMPDRFVLRPTLKIGLFLAYFGALALANVIVFKTADALLFHDNVVTMGGYGGIILGWPLTSLLGFWGAIAVLSVLLLIAIVLILNTTVGELASRLNFFQHFSWPTFSLKKNSSDDDGSTVRFDDSGFERHEVPTKPMASPDAASTLTDEDSSGDESESEVVEVEKPRRRKQTFAAIPVDLLELRHSKAQGGDIQAREFTIKKTLENFGIPVEMGEISVGPTVTQYTLKPADGIKLTRLTGLGNDLALSLAAHPIRIEAPIPGKSLVGIEVPNHTIAVVSIRDIIDSKEFRERKSNLTFALGKDVSGKPWVTDLGRMPHLLVAGATGSGKTVCLNTIILSLLFANTPESLRLILIDPKRVELPVYNGIPHLLTPAITQVPKIINSLKWAIGEMDRRFDLLSKTGKRDIGSYNEIAEEKMPHLVIVVDELADLMVAAAAEVEASIIRLAQMARAVGIHLIIATQRPSVDVITGLIKANIPARIAFSVASSTDSRTILDTTGAEKLVGRGDSLFQTSDMSRPKRIQCCYVADREIRKVVDFLTSQLEYPVEYLDAITEKPGRAGSGSSDSFGDDDDELYEEAKDCVVKAGKASASYLQRRLKVGYARAARLIDLLEERGVIGPGDGAKPRDILMSHVADVDGIHFSDNDEG